MSQNPLISVVMPVHNAGQYLAGAVESILQQSYSQLELILVDDHSTDNALAELQFDDARIKIVSTNKHGVVYAMAQGVQHATGDYIARMDADDEALPHRLHTQLEYLNTNQDVGIVAGQVEIFSDQGVAEGFQLYQDWLNNICSPVEIKRELFVESPLPNPTVMFRKEIYQSLGGYHDTSWAEDYDCWLRADAQDVKMAKPNGILLRWRDHGNRLTRTDDRYSQDNFMRAKAHYLANNRLQDKDIVIWGTGPTGVSFYDMLKEQGANIQGFIDVHPRRVGGIKRGLPVWPMEKAESLHNEIIIGAVGSRGARDEIRMYLNEKKLQEGSNYIFVA